MQPDEDNDDSWVVMVSEYIVAAGVNPNGRKNGDPFVSIQHKDHTVSLRPTQWRTHRTDTKGKFRPYCAHCLIRVPERIVDHYMLMQKLMGHTIVGSE